MIKNLRVFIDCLWNHEACHNLMKMGQTFKKNITATLGRFDGLLWYDKLDLVFQIPQTFKLQFHATSFENLLEVGKKI